jgi:tRNA1(Val) A37 N6-methylase TrmN6
MPEKAPEEIYVLDKKVRLLQPPEGGFRTSLDSVMLAAACPAKAGENVLDAGCGVLGAGLCLLWRVPDLHLTGVDWEETYVGLARQNAALNGVEDRVRVQSSDIRAYDPGLGKAVFDHVIINPPYREAGRHTPSPDDLRAQALGHQVHDLTLDDWIKAGHRLVKSGGSVTIIYPTSGLAQILEAMGRKFGAVEMIPLWPRVEEESKRVIVRAIKDRQTPARLHFGLVLHEADGAYTAETEKILRDGHLLC